MRSERLSAEVQNLPDSFRPGRVVRVRGSVWRVERVRRGTDCLAIELAGHDGGGQRRTLLHPFDRIRPVEPGDRPRVVSRRRWVGALRHLLDQVADLTTPVTPVGAKVDVLPYQLEPLLAILTGRASRVLIADDVGLGKTIEAGFILAELFSRGLARRGLVVTPAGLRQQWLDELAQRFAIGATLADAAWLARRTQELPSTVNPWTLPGCYVTSIDFLKQPEVLAAARVMRWDLLVVDEAHLAASSTDRGTMVHDLAVQSQWVVLLTATPHDGDDARFASLCRTGRIESAEDRLLVFRRGSDARGGLRQDRMRVVTVSPTPSELHAHALLERYAKRVWTSPGGNLETRDARLAMTVLLKRAYSSMRALECSARRRLHLLEAAPSSPAQASLPLGIDERGGEAMGDEQPDGVLGAPGLENPAHERVWLSAIAEAARAASRDERKIALVRRLLARTNESLLLFTEYRDTAAWIARLIERHASLEVLHGGLTEQERQQAVSRFVSGRSRVLIATDAAALGLNLQHRCRLVVNLEVPWNPNRVAQRIGRLARIGQQHRVHAVVLVSRRTGEERVLEHFNLRRQRIRASLDQPPREPRTNDLAVGMRILEETKDATSPDRARVPAELPVAPAVEPHVQYAGAALVSQAIGCAHRVLRQRALAAPGGVAAGMVPARLLVASLRLRGSTGWLAEHAAGACLALVRARVIDGRAHPWATTLVTLRFHIGGESKVLGARREAWLRVLGRSRQSLEAEACCRIDEWIAEVRGPIESFMRQAKSRTRALDTRLAAERRRAPCQLGLFASGSSSWSTFDSVDAGPLPGWLAGADTLTVECELALAARLRILPPSTTMLDHGPGTAGTGGAGAG